MTAASAHQLNSIVSTVAQYLKYLPVRSHICWFLTELIFTVVDSLRHICVQCSLLNYNDTSTPSSATVLISPFKGADKGAEALPETTEGVPRSAGDGR